MSAAQPVEEDFFNDLARQPSLPTSGTQTSTTDNSQPSNIDRSELPKPKRVACAICRKRKLKCDGGRPKCGTCARLGHNCAYDEVRRKSGPKRGYVKELEARLGMLRDFLHCSAHLLMIPSAQLRSKPSCRPRPRRRRRRRTHPSPVNRPSLKIHRPRHHHWIMHSQQSPTAMVSQCQCLALKWTTLIPCWYRTCLYLMQAKTCYQTWT